MLCNPVPDLNWFGVLPLCKPFSALVRYFKKWECEKRRLKTRGGDDESVEDVNDDEFERLLGKNNSNTNRSAVQNPCAPPRGQ